MVQFRAKDPKKEDPKKFRKDDMTTTVMVQFRAKDPKKFRKDDMTTIVMVKSPKMT